MINETMFSKGEGTLFGRTDFRYERESDTYICPGDKRLRKHKIRFACARASPAPKTSRPNTAPTFPPQILEAHPGRIVSKEQLEMMGLVAAPEPESVTQGPGQPRPVPRSRPQSLAGLCPPAHRRPSRPGRQWAGGKPPNCFPVIDAETSDLPVDKSNADGLTAY
jgi:hypothetical protein